jgi:hypothetical protein
MEQLHPESSVDEMVGGGWNPDVLLDIGRVGESRIYQTLQKID